MRAMDEATQLRVEKRNLEEMIKKLQEELSYLGEQYEDKLLKVENQNLDGERHDLENETNVIKTELSELSNVNKDKDTEVERLQSEIERLKTWCNDMKQFFKEYALEKENLKKELKESAQELSEASFLAKEKDLQHKIEELEKQLEILDKHIENPQFSANLSTVFTPVIDADVLLENDLLTLDEALQIANKAVLMALNSVSILTSVRADPSTLCSVSIEFTNEEATRNGVLPDLVDGNGTSEAEISVGTPEISQYKEKNEKLRLPESNMFASGSSTLYRTPTSVYPSLSCFEAALLAA
ncbi:hypothetical protein Tco_1285346 [Tanacetum coccineum]